MKLFATAACVVLLVQNGAWAQSGATGGQKPGTQPPGAQGIQPRKPQVDASRRLPGPLRVEVLRVGAEGTPTFIGRVVEIIDQNHMLVGVEEARLNLGKFNTMVIVKSRTKGMEVGESIQGPQGWKKVTNSDYLKVTGTAPYKGSGAKRAFIVEPWRFTPQIPLPNVKQPPTINPRPNPGATQPKPGTPPKGAVGAPKGSKTP